MNEFPSLNSESVRFYHPCLRSSLQAFLYQPRSFSLFRLSPSIDPLDFEAKPPCSPPFRFLTDSGCFLRGTFNEIKGIFSFTRLLISPPQRREVLSHISNKVLTSPFTHSCFWNDLFILCYSRFPRIKGKNKIQVKYFS
jgi:hypothetical protein